MPFSDAETLTGTGSAGDYDAGLARLAAGLDGIATAYHAVRQMPYSSGPDRTPLTALRTGRGACTAKHLILRDLLRRLGAQAEVELVEGDFAAAMPVHVSMPASLASEIRQGGIRDFHCRVRLKSPGAPDRLLDATWPDAMAEFGFAVARDWDGTGDTLQAIPDVRLAARTEDVLGTKVQLLATLPADVAARRLQFLREFSDWIAAAQTAVVRP